MSEILSPVEFGVIKEYIEAEATDAGISRVTGLSRKVVGDIRKAPHYKAYMNNLKLIHRNKTKKVIDMDNVMEAIEDVAKAVKKLAKEVE